MVMAVDGREFNNVAEIPCSYGTTVRRVAITKTTDSVTPQSPSAKTAATGQT